MATGIQRLREAQGRKITDLTPAVLPSQREEEEEEEELTGRAWLQTAREKRNTEAPSSAGSASPQGKINGGNQIEATGESEELTGRAWLEAARKQKTTTATASGGSAAITPQGKTETTRTAREMEEELDTLGKQISSLGAKNSLLAAPLNRARNELDKRAGNVNAIGTKLNQLKAVAEDEKAPAEERIRASKTFDALLPTYQRAGTEYDRLARGYDQALPTAQAGAQQYQDLLQRYQTTLGQYDYVRSRGNTRAQELEKEADELIAQARALESRSRGMAEESDEYFAVKPEMVKPGEMDWTPEQIGEFQRQGNARVEESRRLAREAESVTEQARAKLKEADEERERYSAWKYQQDMQEYADLPRAADFAAKSQADPELMTPTGKAMYLPIMDATGTVQTGTSVAGTGYKDITYAIINGDKDAFEIQSTDDQNTADDHSYLLQMDDEQRAMYNYLYSTQGKKAADGYLEKITPQLLAKQREIDQKFWKEYSQKNWGGASALSILVSPLKAVSYLGQLGDVIAGRELDPNATYNKYVHIPNDIRAQVSQQFEDKYGEKGSNGYQIAMSMADFMYNAFLTGDLFNAETGIKFGLKSIAKGMTKPAIMLMMAERAAEAVVENKERGLDDTRAIIMGTASGLIEGITESISLETLLDATGMADFLLGYLIKNRLAEGSEEISSDLLNWTLDELYDLISGESNSEYKQQIRENVKNGMSSRDAAKTVIQERFSQAAWDFIGGWISGGIMSSAGLVFNRAQGRIQMNQDYAMIGKDYRGAWQDLIREGLQLPEGSEARSYAEQLMDKLARGQKVTDADLGRLVLANEQALENGQTVGNLNGEPSSVASGETFRQGEAETAAQSTTPAQGTELPGISEMERYQRMKAKAQAELPGIPGQKEAEPQQTPAESKPKGWTANIRNAMTDARNLLYDSEQATLTQFQEVYRRLMEQNPMRNSGISMDEQQELLRLRGKISAEIQKRQQTGTETEKLTGLERLQAAKENAGNLATAAAETGGTSSVAEGTTFPQGKAGAETSSAAEGATSAQRKADLAAQRTGKTQSTVAEQRQRAQAGAATVTNVELKNADETVQARAESSWDAEEKAVAEALRGQGVEPVFVTGFLLNDEGDLADYVRDGDKLYIRADHRTKSVQQIAEEATGTALGISAVQTAPEAEKPQERTEPQKKLTRAQATMESAREAGADQETAKAAARLAGVLKRDIRFYYEPEQNGTWTNGYTENGVIYINAAVQKHPVAWVVGHELTHNTEHAKAYQGLLKLARQAYGDRWESMIQKRLSSASRIAEERGDQSYLLNRENAERELVADYFATELLTNEEAIRRVCQYEPTTARRIVAYLKNLLSKLKGEEPTLEWAIDRYNAALRETAQRAKEAAELRTSKPGRQAQTAADVKAANYSVQSIFDAAGFSVSLRGGRVIARDGNGQQITEMTEDMVSRSGIGAMVRYAQNVTGSITAEEAKTQIEGLTRLFNLMLQAQDGDMVWRFAGSAMFSAVKSNSDGQYSTTVDFSTVCKKTQEMMETMSRVMVKTHRGLTKAQIIELQNDILEEHGLVPCPVCYVFSRWAGVGGILDNMAKYQQKYDGAEWDDPERVRARIAQLKAATKNKASLRELLKAEDSSYLQYTGELEANKNEQKQLKAERKRLTGKKADQAANAARVAEIDKRMKELAGLAKMLEADIKGIEASGAPEAAWLERVRLSPDYREQGYVEEDLLYNLLAADELAERKPLAWGYRTTRGPSAGKAILPYSDMRLGDWVLGPGKNSAGGKNMLFSSVEEEFSNDQTKKIEEARKKVLAQNLIGGQRYQSTSDFMYDYGLDYLLSFFEGQMLGSKMQTYTKVMEFVNLVASVHGDVNISMMPLDAGYVTEADGRKHLIYSSVTGANPEAAIRANHLFDNAQLILVGINDEHISLALEDSEETGGSEIGFVIPYHASGASINTFIRGLVENLNETFNEENYKNYEPIQNDSHRKGATKTQQAREQLRRYLLTGRRGSGTYLPTANENGLTDEELKLLKGKSKDISGRSFDELRAIEKAALAGDKAAIKEYESWSAGFLGDMYRKMWTDQKAADTYSVRLSGVQSEHIMPHEYWDTAVDRAHAYVNGFRFRSYCYSLGLTPRFTGIDSAGRIIGYGDFSDAPGYWKTLIDRPMYDNEGRYRDQQTINTTELSASIDGVYEEGTAGSGAGMLSPSYGREFWGENAQTPDTGVAARAAERYMERQNITESTRKYSAQKEVLARDDVDWMDDFSSIKQQLSKHAAEINEMDPVAVVEYDSESGNTLEKLVGEQPPKIGGTFISRNGIGFDFDKTGINILVHHAANRRELRAAVLAAPYVAKFGKLIAGQRNHENTGMTTLTFAAPVILNGDTVNEGVAIQFTNKGRPRAVNVELQDGGAFELKKIETPKGGGSLVYRYDKGKALPTIGASEGTITETEGKSKRNYSAERASDLYRNEYDFTEPMPAHEFGEKIKEESKSENYFPKGLSEKFLKAISRRSVFNATKLYRGIDAAEFDSLIENKFVKSNGSYNFSDQQGQTLASEDPREALSYATGFAPKEIAKKHYEGDMLPSYLIEFVNAPDLNVSKNNVQESYTYDMIDQGYITRIFEITYDPETQQDMVRDVTTEMRKLLPELGKNLSGLAHGRPMFFRDKTTGTILYAVQGPDGWENGKYISEKDPSMTFDPEMMSDNLYAQYRPAMLGISGNESDLEPMTVGPNGTLVLERGRQYSAESDSDDSLRQTPKTPALEKLGIRLAGGVGRYELSEQLLARDRAAKKAKAEVVKAEKKLKASAKVKHLAAGIASGALTESDIPNGINKRDVLTLADYYFAENSFDLDMLKQVRAQINDELQTKAEKLLEDVDFFKHVGMLQLNERTPERSFRAMFGKDAKEITDWLIRPVQLNEAEKTRWYNRQMDRVRTFEDSKGQTRELTRYESKLTMLVMEGKAVAAMVANMETQGMDADAIRNAAENIRKGEDPAETSREFNLDEKGRELAGEYARWMDTQIELKNADSTIIKAAAEEYGKIFDEFYAAINDFLAAHGYDPIGYIKGYAPHMQPEESQTLLQKALKNMGVNMEVKEVPASIAGQTAFFKPNKRWDPYFLTRTGTEAEYDIVKAYQSYVDYMADVLYHMDDIMRARNFSKAIRKTYSPEEISERISQAQYIRRAPHEDRMTLLRDVGEISKTAILSPAESSEKMEDYVERLFDKTQDTTTYSDLVRWLDNYANVLAGKQSFADRGWEYSLGRKSLNFANRLNNAFQRSLVAGSLTSVLNQTAQIPMIKAELGDRWFYQAITDIIRGKTRQGSFMQDSDFLVGKAGKDVLYTDNYDKFISALFKPANLMDNLVSTVAVRGAFLKAVNQGQSYSEAMHTADDFGRRLMGSREKGSRPLAYESKGFFSKMIHMFQVEVANGWDHIVSDLPDEIKTIAKEKGKDKAARTLAALIVRALLSAFLLNRAAEEVYGGTPAPFDVLGLAAGFVASGKGLTTNDYLKSIVDDVLERMGQDRAFGTDAADGEFDFGAAAEELGYNVMNDVPLLRNLASVLGLGDETLPLPGAGGEFTDFFTAIKDLIDGGADEGEIGEAIRATLKLAAQVAPGGRQITKTAEGIETAIRGGSYNKSGKLQYAIEGPADTTRAVLFGKNATHGAQAHWASGDKTMSAKQTELYETLKGYGMSSAQALEYIRTVGTFESDKDENGKTISGSQKAKVLDYIDSQPLTDEQKDELYYAQGYAESTIDDAPWHQKGGAGGKSKTWAKADLSGLMLPPTSRMDEQDSELWDMEAHGGNVNLRTRKTIPVTSKNIDIVRGWGMDSEVGDYMTVASQTFRDGNRAIVVTPILPDGTLMTQEELNAYMESLRGSTDYADADDRGIILGVFDSGNWQRNLEESDRFARRIHEIHEEQEETRRANESILPAMPKANQSGPTLPSR